MTKLWKVKLRDGAGTQTAYVEAESVEHALRIMGPAYDFTPDTVAYVKRLADCVYRSDSMYPDGFK